MNKFISFFTHNWLLKLISLILAIVVYLSLKEDPSSSGKNAGKTKQRGYETMTEAILKALNTAKNKESTTEETKGEEVANPPPKKPEEKKKVSGQKNAK